jgi:hypothetical protein
MVLGEMTGAGEIGAPAHLTPDHDLAAFDSGVPALDTWLKRRALANEEAGASRTYVVTARGRVVGYYPLASGAVAQAAAPGRVKRNRRLSFADQLYAIERGEIVPRADELAST